MIKLIPLNQSLLRSEQNDREKSNFPAGLEIFEAIKNNNEISFFAILTPETMNLKDKYYMTPLHHSLNFGMKDQNLSLYILY